MNSYNLQSMQVQNIHSEHGTSYI